MSRRPGDILAEVRSLAAQGVVELTLLGQNVDTYGRDLALDGRRRSLFADLLRQVGSVDGISRVRFTSPHPADFKRDVIEAMAETQAVCEQLHLPLQSGSDRILSAMRRGYNTQRYLEKLALARELIPDLSVSTDIIVGFPSETESDFEATLDLVREVEFDSAYMFIFSPRPGTRAAAMVEDFIPGDVISERFARLVEIQNASSLKRNQEMVGRSYEVLGEGPSRKDPDVATTRTRGGKLVHLRGQVAPGEFRQAEVVSASPITCSGDDPNSGASRAYRLGQDCHCHRPGRASGHSDCFRRQHAGLSRTRHWNRQAHRSRTAAGPTSDDRPGRT